MVVVPTVLSLRAPKTVRPAVEARIELRGWQVGQGAVRMVSEIVDRAPLSIALT
jgi:hypothetical protein